MALVSSGENSSSGLQFIQGSLGQGQDRTHLATRIPPRLQSEQGEVGV